MSRRVHFVMSEELLQRIDAALPPETSRGEFVRKAVERALDQSPVEAATVRRSRAEVLSRQDEDAAGGPGAVRATKPSGSAPAEQPRKRKTTQSPPKDVPEPPEASQGPTKASKSGHADWCTCFECHLARQGRR